MNTESVINNLMALDEEELFYKKYSECTSREMKKKLLEGPGEKYSVLMGWISARMGGPGFYTIYDTDYSQNITVRKHLRCGESFWHNHSFYELIYVYAGTAENMFLSEKQLLHAGELLIIPPFISHKIDAGENSLVFNIIVKKDFWLDITSSTSLSGRLAISEIGGERMEDRRYVLEKCPLYSNAGKLLDVIISEVFCYGSDDTILEPLIRSLVNIIGKIHDKKDNTPVPSIADEIIKYVRDNYASVTLGSLSEHFGYAPAYMSSLIHSAAGCYFTDIVKKIRINEACRIIANENVRIGDVPYMVGYSNSVYFNRLFKEYVGMSPMEYRRQYRQQEII